MKFAKMMLLAAMVAMVGCGDDDNDNTPIQDGGPNNGTDSNTSVVQPTDSQPQLPTGPCMLNADASNAIVRTTNSCGVQGVWFTYADTVASSVEIYRGAAGQVCARGTAEQAEADDTWKTWGAGIGLTLCGFDDGTDVPISQCAAAPKLATMLGFRIKMTGAAGKELRVTMGEYLIADGKNREESTFITAKEDDLTNGAVVNYLFEKATVEYDASAPPLDPTQVRALQLQVSSNKQAPVPFDFCVESLQVLFPEDMATTGGTDVGGTDTNTNAGM